MRGSKDFAISKDTKALEGAVAGGGSGAIVGGALGWLVGVGLLAIPGIGPFIAAGPIMAILAGVGVGGTVGTVVGALIGLGMPEYEAKRYEGRIKEGGILLSVHCDSSEWVKRAEEIVEKYRRGRHPLRRAKLLPIFSGGGPAFTTFWCPRKRVRRQHEQPEIQSEIHRG